MTELLFPAAVEESADHFDRDEHTARIRAALSATPRRTVVILGGRLMGKTSLLNVTAQWAQRDGAFAVVRLAHVTSRADLAAEIVHGVQVVTSTSGSTGGPAAMGPNTGRRDATGGFRFSTVSGLVTTVQAMIGRHPGPGRRLLLCIDEFDGMLAGCDDEQAQQILNLVLFLTEHTTLPIRFLLTISAVPARVRLSYSSPFLNQSVIVELEPWAPAVAAAFTRWLLHGALELDEQTQDIIFRAAGGHPYFTKAVLRSLLQAHQQGRIGRQPSAQEVTDAVDAAARSREVGFSLSNIVDAHLPDNAVQLLDRAGSSQGVDRRDIRDLEPLDEVAQTLADSGLLHCDGTRYRLRVGLWRQWRAARGPGQPPRRLHRPGAAGTAGTVGQTLLRMIGNRATTAALVWLLGGLLLILMVATIVYLPQTSTVADGCTGAGAGLRVVVGYPTHLSVGDRLQLGIAVTNTGGFAVHHVKLLVSFPDLSAGDVDITSRNAFDLGQLDPGEQKTDAMQFSYHADRPLASLFNARVAVALVVKADSTACPGKQWSIPVAPVPYLRQLQKGVIGLIGLVMAPWLVEWLVRRWGGARTTTRPGQGSTGGFGRRTAGE